MFSPAIKSHLTHIALLLLVFAVCEYFICPTVVSSLNDDWSYKHSVIYLQETGKIDIGYWPAMSLVAHILWGNLFVSLFGDSHFVLRCSTLCLSAFTIVLLYSLSFRYYGSFRASLLTTLFLIFNPLWFLLSNSFMTDVPFLFWTMLGIYCAEKMIMGGRYLYVIGFSIACVQSILIRQFGMALPASFLIFGLIAVLTKRINFRQAAMILLPVCLSVITYVAFENWIPGHLPEVSAYQSASNLTKDLSGLFQRASETFVHRFSQTLFYLGLFIGPFCVSAAYLSLKDRSWVQKLIVLVPALAVVFFMIPQIMRFPIGNSFYNCGLGLQSLYDVTLLQTNKSHTYSTAFEFLVEFLGALGGISLSVLVIGGVQSFITRLLTKQKIHLFKVFLVLFALAYFLLVCISQSFFDRYTLPLLLPVLLLCKVNISSKKPVAVIAGAYLFLMSCFSVLATKDYFNWHEARVVLINKALKEGKPAEEINGGFEYVAETFYGGSWWSRWVGYTTPYKVTCGPLPHHRRVDYVAYRRYVPYQMDTIFLYQGVLSSP